jgi:hypothetical protein
MKHFKRLVPFFTFSLTFAHSRFIIDKSALLIMFKVSPQGEQQDNKIKVPNGDTLGLQYTHSQRDSRTQNGEQKRIHPHVY